MAHTENIKHFVWVRLKREPGRFLAYFPDKNSIPYVMESTFKELGYEINNNRAFSDGRVINAENFDGFWLYPLRDYEWEIDS